MGKTTIQVPEEIADELHQRKERGDTYADVIARLLESGVVEEREEAGDSGGLVVRVPGHGEKKERRERAVRAVIERLEEEGRVRKDELLGVAVPVAGETYSDERSLWKNLLLPALQEYGGVEPEGNSGWWRWVCED